MHVVVGPEEINEKPVENVLSWLDKAKENNVAVDNMKMENTDINAFTYNNKSGFQHFHR